MSDRHHNNIDVFGTHVPPVVVSALEDLVLEPKRRGVVCAVGFHSGLVRGEGSSTINTNFTSSVTDPAALAGYQQNYGVSSDTTAYQPFKTSKS